MDSKDNSGPRAGAAQARRISLSLSPATLVSGAILLFFGFVAVFALGVLLGRGHSPETRIPEIARIMPEPAPTTAPTIIAPGDDGQAAARDALAPEPGPEEATRPDGNRVISQEDLGYREHLKSPTRQEPKRSSRQESQTPPAKKPEEGKKADSGKKSAPDKKAPEPPARKPETQTADTARPKSADTRVYHYVYQAASYKDQASSDKFAAKLRAAGFKARTEKSDGGGVIWYRTVVDFTGRPDDTDSLRDKLQKHGVPKVLLRSKLPAN